MSTYILPTYLPPRNIKIVKNITVITKEDKIFDYIFHYIDNHTCKLIIRSIDYPTGWEKPIEITIEHNDTPYPFIIEPSSQLEKEIILHINQLGNEIFEYHHPPNQKIPKKIFQTWRTAIVSAQMYYAVQSIIDKNPEYEYHFFSDKDMDLYIKKNFSVDITNAYFTLIPPAFKADLWRYCVLWKEGGVYIDIKMVFRVGFHDIIQPLDDCLFCTDRNIIPCDNIIWNGIIGSIENNTILNDIMHRITLHAQQKIYESNSLSVTGPILLGKCVNTFLQKAYSNNLYSTGNQKKDLQLNINLRFSSYIKDNITRDNRHIYLYNSHIACTHYLGYYHQKTNKIYWHYHKLWKRRLIYYPQANASLSKKCSFWLRFILFQIRYRLKAIFLSIKKK